VHETLQKEIDVERTAHVAALGAAQEERQRLQTSIQDLEGKIQQSESARGATGAELARVQDQTQRLEATITDLQGQLRSARKTAEGREIGRAAGRERGWAPECEVEGEREQHSRARR